ncbi:hypothetical protein HN51_061614 [Arachis hypogaea]
MRLLKRPLQNLLEKLLEQMEQEPLQVVLGMSLIQRMICELVWRVGEMSHESRKNNVMWVLVRGGEFVCRLVRRKSYGALGLKRGLNKDSWKDWSDI